MGMVRKRVRMEKGVLSPWAMRPGTALLTACVLAAMMFMYALSGSHTYANVDSVDIQARPGSWSRGMFSLFGMVPFRDYVGSGQGSLWESDEAQGWRAEKVADSSSTGVTVFPTTRDIATKLLLASHNRLGWYDLRTEQFTVIHENQGVYYGGFPGEKVDENGVPKTVWVVSRPHNWRPSSTSEWLLELDAHSGEELRRVQLGSRFTHDVVRRGGRVYVANTGEGNVLELSFPSMKPIRSLNLFTEKEHVNTLSPTAYGTMWAMLHNLGPSILVEIDLASGLQTRRVPGVGLKSHGVVQWRNYIVSLDSDNGSLMLIDPRLFPTRNQSDAASAYKSKLTWRLWSVQEPGIFLKGLTVVDDIAYFGIAPSQTRQARESTNLNCELGAFDLIEGVLLWRKQVMTKGLLNVVAAPQLQVESTAVAVWVSNAGLGYRATPEYAKSLSQAKRKLTLLELEPLEETDPLVKYPPVLSPRTWASGWPRFDLVSKNNGSGILSGAQLPLFRMDVSKLKEFVSSLSEDDFGEERQRKTNAWLNGREKNLHNVKPGVSSIHLIFSDQDGNDVYEFPWYYERPFGKLIDPILDKILGEDVRNIIRVQLARMPPGSLIKKHVDNGRYSTNGHRIHVVISSSPAITFHVCAHGREDCIPLHVEEGLVFELNNRLQHYVDNPEGSNTVRVHMVIDVVESVRTRKRLLRGQECFYAGQKIVCDVNGSPKTSG